MYTIEEELRRFKFSVFDFVEEQESLPSSVITFFSEHLRRVT